MDAIFSRRSIRKYTSEPVKDEDIRKLLEAAMAAPSAGNGQPWHYLIINDRDSLDRISEIHPHSAMMREAPVAIIVCAEPELSNYKHFWVQDCSAATQNILLMAREIGLGSVWLGLYPEVDILDELRKIFNLPENIMPFSIIPVGYSAEKKEPVDRFKESRIHINNW